MMRQYILFLLLLLAGCGPFTESNPQTKYEPVMMKREQLEKAVQVETPQPLYAPGKLYVKDNYIFLNEKYEGVHIIDNSNIKNPVNIGFLRIPGCIDIAIKGTTLYADNATDLVSIDIANPSVVKVLGRARNVFPELVPPDLGSLPVAYTPEKRPKDLIIVGWKKK